MHGDDLQTYLELQEISVLVSLNWLIIAMRLSMCGWTTLKLRFDRTEFILISKGRIRDFLQSSLTVSLLNNIMEPAKSVKNLSVTLDAGNSIQRHVANVC